MRFPSFFKTNKDEYWLQHYHHYHGRCTGLMAIVLDSRSSGLSLIPGQVLVPFGKMLHFYNPSLHPNV